MHKQAQILMDLLSRENGAEDAIHMANSYARDRRDDIIAYNMYNDNMSRDTINELKAAHALHTELRDAKYNEFLRDKEESIRYAKHRAQEVLKLETKTKAKATVRDITHDLEDVEY